VSDEIELTDAPDPAAREVLLKKLIAFNEAKAGPLGWRALALLVRSKGGEVAGGLWARTAFGWLYVELLFIPEDRRAGGLGTRLMRRAEEEAIKRGCHHAWLDTFSFQARGFYEKLGYRVFGTLENYPVGHSRFFMTKSLAEPNTL
jgi:GNAT superfamily N-acetyltransferase